MKKQYFKNEDEIVSCLKKWLGSPKAPWGIGDDAALLQHAQKIEKQNNPKPEWLSGDVSAVTAQTSGPV